MTLLKIKLVYMCKMSNHTTVHCTIHLQKYGANIHHYNCYKTGHYEKGLQETLKTTIHKTTLGILQSCKLSLAPKPTVSFIGGKNTTKQLAALKQDDMKSPNMSKVSFLRILTSPNKTPDFQTNPTFQKKKLANT